MPDGIQDPTIEETPIDETLADTTTVDASINPGADAVPGLNPGAQDVQNVAADSEPGVAEGIEEPEEVQESIPGEEAEVEAQAEEEVDEGDEGFKLLTFEDVWKAPGRAAEIAG